MLWNMSILNLKTVAGLWIGGGKKMCFCLFLSGISRVKLCKKIPFCTIMITYFWWYLLGSFVCVCVRLCVSARKGERLCVCVYARACVWLLWSSSVDWETAATLVFWLQTLLAWMWLWVPLCLAFSNNLPLLHCSCLEVLFISLCPRGISWQYLRLRSAGLHSHTSEHT